MQERQIIFNSGAEGRVNERNSISCKLLVRVRESILWTLNSLELQISSIPWHGQAVPM